MNLDEILKEAEREFAAAASLPFLDQVKARFIGKSGAITEQMKGLGSNIMLVLPGGITAGGVRLGAQTGQSLTEEDAAAIAREIPEVQVAAPSLRTGAGRPSSAIQPRPM